MKAIYLTKAARRWVSALAVLAFGAGVGRAQEEENWLKHLRVGAVAGLNIKAKFSMGGNFNVSGSSPGEAGTGGTHVYDDGYVKPDKGTNPDFTSNWGYKDDSQYDGASQTLTFHKTQSFSTSGGSKEADDVQLGVDLAYGGDLGRWLCGWYGWEVGFSFFPMSMRDERKLSGDFSRVIHQFSTGGIIPPTAPYNGGDSGIGANIPNTATDLGTDSIAGTITGSRELNTFLYSLRLGPTMTWEIRPYFAVQISGGPAIAYASAEYKFNETLNLADGSQSKNKGSFSNDEVLFGGYVSALFMYHTVEDADIYVGVQYMPLGSISVNGPGRKATLELSGGIYFSAGVNWPF